MSPLPGHTIIPAGFSAHHRSAVRSVMTARVRIDRRTASQDDDGEGWSPSTGATAPAEDDALWTGPARVQAQASAALNPEVAEQRVAVRDYLVQLPVDVPPLSIDDGGDTITVLSCPDDPDLVGRRMRVADIPHGTLLWARDVIATDDLSSNGPTS